MAFNITPTTIKKAKDLLEIVNKNQPHSSPWNDAERKLEDLFRSFWQQDTPKKIRLQYYGSGIYNEVLIPLINSPPGTHTDAVLCQAWALIDRSMSITDIHEQDNMETLEKGIQLGFIELAVRELRFRPLRYDGFLMKYAYIVLTAPSAYGKFINNLVSAGTPSACLQLIMDAKNTEDDTVRINLLNAIRTLSNMSRFNIDAVRALPGLLDVIKPHLPLLSRDDDDNLTLLGFNAARLLIRLYGKDDSSRIIMENPIILNFYPQLMRRVMDVGISQNYSLYGAYWKLAQIALDLSLISMSDTNKQLLVPIVPLMLEMMAFHHDGERDVLRYGVVFLSQVAFDESCLAELKKGQERVKTIQGIILSDKEHDKETLSFLSVVMNTVFPPQSVSVPSVASTTTTTTAAKRRSSAFQRVTSLIKGGNNTSTLQFQVMISYHQKSTGQTAQALVQLFKKRNYKVWVDYESMKGDIQEAMAEAVQSSDIIVVLVSIGYKESANCRMECQYAMKQNKPLLFLVCEQSYTSPTGWLGLIMGQKMWVGVFTPAMVEDKADEVVRRLDETLKGEDEATTTTAATTSTVAATTTTVTHHGPTMGELVANLVKEVDLLKSENITLKSKLAQTDVKIAQMDVEISTLKGEIVKMNKGG
jgi:hypothetical protein